MATPKFVRMPSIRKHVDETLSAHRNDLVFLLSRYLSKGKGILQPHHLLDALENAASHKLADDPFFEEAIVLSPFVAIVVRPRPGVWEYVCVNVNELSVFEYLRFCVNVNELSVFEYLRFKEELVDGHFNDNYVLELDFKLFNGNFPRPCRSSSISNGVQFLNRHLSSIMFRNKDCLEPLLDFLRAHKYKGHVMMLNDRIKSVPRLQSLLAKAKEYLSKIASDTPFSEFANVYEILHLWIY